MPAATAINTAIGETAVHVSDDDTFAVTIKCHDANGEAFPVEAATFMIPRDHLRAHYNRHDDPVEVLGGGS